MRIRLPLFEYIFVFGLCLTLCFLLPRCVKKPDVPSSAPDFTLKTVHGQEIILSSLKGKVILLDFWATWCGPCKESIPHLIHLYRNYRDKGFELIGMSMDKADQIELVRRFIGSMEIPYPVIITPEEVAKNYKVTGFPTTILIDRQGKVREKIIGFNNGIAKQLVAKVEELTSEKP